MKEYTNKKTGWKATISQALELKGIFTINFSNNVYGGSPYNSSSASNNNKGQQFGSNKNVTPNPYLNTQGYSGVTQTP